MEFTQQVSVENILTALRVKIDALIPHCPCGITVEINERKKQRSYQQNRFMHKVFAHIVAFYHETGFLPPGLSPWAMNDEVLKVYFKHLFNVKHSHRMSTKECAEFVNRIQLWMLEQSKGQYTHLIPDDGLEQAYNERW